MQQCSAEDVVQVVLSHLAPSLTLWQFLSARCKATSSSSSSVTTDDPPVSVATDTDKSDIDVAMMMNEFASLQRRVKSFCDSVLERHATEITDVCSRNAEKSPQKGPVSTSGLPTSNQDLCPQNDTTLCTYISSDGSENVGDVMTDKDEAPSTEKWKNTNSVAGRNSSSNVSSMQLSDGDPSNSSFPLLSLADSVDVGGESSEPNSGRHTSGNSGNSHELPGIPCTVSVVNSEAAEMNGIPTCASKRLDIGKISELDHCTDSSGPIAMNIADGDTVVAEKAQSENPDIAPCQTDNVADDSQLESGLSMLFSDSAGETDQPAVSFINNVLQVSIFKVM